MTLSQFDDAFDTVDADEQPTFRLELRAPGDDRPVRRGRDGSRPHGQDLAALPEEDRPGRVLLVVVTDGHENSSHEYTVDQVRSMLTVQREQSAGRCASSARTMRRGRARPLGGHDPLRQHGAGNRAVFAAMSGSMRTYRDAPGAGQALEMPDEIGNGSPPSQLVTVGCRRGCGCSPSPHRPIGALPVVQTPRLRGVHLQGHPPAGRPVRSGHERRVTSIGGPDAGASRAPQWRARDP